MHQFKTLSDVKAAIAKVDYEIACAEVCGNYTLVKELERERNRLRMIYRSIKVGALK